MVMGQSLQTLYFAVLIAVGVERGLELFLSIRHARLAFARGAVEAGRGHYLPMVLTHAIFLPACAWEVIALERHLDPVLFASMGLLLSASMGLRYWAVLTLGERWNTRVIVLPETPAAAGGPYRFVRHPNYISVTAEMLLIPLMGSAWVCALVFSLVNWALLRVRIRAEEQALREHCGYDEVMGHKPSFVPGS